MHIGVFIILLLSGERNFGVRLNKPYTNRASFDITVFTGNHADLLIIVSQSEFHFEGEIRIFFHAFFSVTVLPQCSLSQVSSPLGGA